MRMYGVKGQWAGALNVGGVDIPVDIHQYFQEITIRSHIHMDLPSLTLNFLDIGGFMVNKINIRDGMEVTVAMGDGMSSAPMPATFLMTGGPQVAPGTGADQVQQKALLAKPSWPRKIWDQSMEGTTDAVIRRIASEAGMRVEADTAQDAQKWLPNNRPLAQYARFLASRAWFGEMSAPIQGIREDGTYLYKDIDKLIKSPGIATIGMQRGMIPYLEHMFTSKAKVYNSVRGYGSTSILDDGSGVIKEFGQIAASLLSGFGGIGGVWASAVGTLGTRVEWSPIDSGNVHKNYHQAKHHNPRIKGLYGEDVKIILDRESGVDLLQMVNFQPFDKHTGGVISAYAGNYMVTGKVRTLKKQRYYECLTLTSQSSNV